MITQIPATKRTWNRVKLGDVCKINPRRSAKLVIEPDSKTTFVPMAGVDGESGTIAQPQVKDFSEVSRGYTYFEEGDVLFAKITPCMQNGKHAVASGLLNGFGFGSTEFHVVRPSDEIMAEWIHSFLRQPRVLTEAQRHFRGAVGQQRVPKEFLIDLSIPLPPLAEQKRIVARLNAQMAVVDRAKAAAREILDAAEALNAAIIRELMPYLGHQLADFWKWGKLGEICEITLGQSPPSDTYRKSPEGLPFFQGKADFGEVNPKPTTWCVAPKKIAEPGDILISVRAPVGPTNVASERCSIGRGLAALRPRDGLDRDFLLAGLKFYEPQIADMSSGSTFKAITGRQLRETAFPIPPLDEQRRIVAILNERSAAARNLQSAARGGLDAVEAMPSALLRRALGDGG